MVKATTKRAVPAASRKAAPDSPARSISEPDAQLEKRRRRFGNDGFGGGNGERPLAGDAAWQAATEAEEARQAALDKHSPPADGVPGLLDAAPNQYAAPPPIEEVPPALGRAPRPPAQLTNTSLQAAVKLGMKSAGLAWLQTARACDAAVSAATGPPAGEQRQTREPKWKAATDVPIVGEPPRHEREIVLPVPEGFVWPDFTFIAFCEHSGEEREANANVGHGGVTTCSVADRRSILPPSRTAWHFIGTVHDFVHAYPHPIRRSANHMTCGLANWASWKFWPAKILDGSMRKSAEDFLWINCLGDRSLGEQPPSAHQHTVGPPTFTVNGHDFGAPSKTYCKWARNLPAVEPTDVLPPEQRWSELAASGSPEAKMVKRSYTPRTIAKAEARAHSAVTGGDESEFGRPASVPCKAYTSWRAQLAHSFGLFAAHYAPTVSAEWLAREHREPALIMVPFTQSHLGPCAMVSLLQPNSVFGAERDVRRGGAEQGESVAAFITGGYETVYASPLKDYGHGDAVILVPWTTPPITVLQTVDQRDTARQAGLSAAWCTLGALHDHAAYLPTLLAFQRIAALTTAGEHGNQQPGTWAHAQPMVHARTARKWAQAPDGDAETVAEARKAFLAAEVQSGAKLRQYLTALDDGDGELVAIADSVKTAADLQDEIPFPANGLPDFSSAALRLVPFAERPLSLDTSWLARLPPQRVPPGFKPLPWEGILRFWARREICHTMNATADRDFECWAADGVTSLPRPKFLCIGPGGGMQIAHADGIGTYNAMSIVYELDESTGLFDLLDYARKGRTHWTLNALRKIFGIHDDRQLMSLIMDGVRWGVDAPLQIRIAPNLERLDSRIRGVGAAFKKLIDKGLYYKYKRLRRVNEKIKPDGPSPFIIIPPYIVGTGGTDKPDNPDEKRIIGDQTSPHPEQEIRERNSPHGPPDGPPLVSMNNMMGPTPGTTPRGQRLDESRYPMPDPESKPRPRQTYNDSAVIRHMAWVNGGSSVCAVKDDGRHMFFQFEQAPEEERTCHFLVIMLLPALDENGAERLDAKGKPILELWLILMVATCMNMGSRNASKIAQRFTDRLLEGFSQLLDIYVRDTWLPRQSTALQDLLAERSAKLGPRNARPFSTSGYTDDYYIAYIDEELTAVGTLIWRTACKQANYWLSAKAGAGTIVDYIGGRLVLNGGFGCLPPTKHARAVADSMAAADGVITRDRLESHNSFLVHVHDWLNFPEGTLKGLSAPLKLPGQPEDAAVVSDGVKQRHRDIVSLLHNRRAASFWTGIDEASAMLEAKGASFIDGIVFAPRFASDSCSDVARPHICGVAAGLFWRFPLEDEWANRHITLTEACGTVLCNIIFPRYFPVGQLMVEGDASAGLAAARGTAAAADLNYLRRRAEKEPAYREAMQRAWITHCKGWANGLSDAGSRDKMNVMRALAEAFGMRLREIPIPPEAYALMADVLANTTSTAHDGGDHDTSMGKHNLNMIGNMPVAQDTLLGLLYKLSAALQGEEPPSEIDRYANLVAVRAGAERPTSTARLAVSAACRMICQPSAYPSVDIASNASGTTARRCREWRVKIMHAIAAEAAAPQPMQDAPADGGAGSSGAQAGETAGGGASGGHAGACDAPQCAPAERTAIDGLVAMAQRSEAGGLSPPRGAQGQPPPSAPPSPPETADAPPEMIEGGEIMAWLDELEVEHPFDEWLDPTGLREDALMQLDAGPGARECPHFACGAPWLRCEPAGCFGFSCNSCGIPRPPPWKGCPNRSRCCFIEPEMVTDSRLGDSHGEPAPSPVETPERAASAHRTSRGRHNLNLVGDMPIAEDDMEPSPDQLPRPHAREVTAAAAARRNECSPDAEVPTAGATAPRRNECSPDAEVPAAAPQLRGRAARFYSPSPSGATLSARASPRHVKPEHSTDEFDEAVEAHPQALRSASPQPATAAEARRRAAVDVAQQLASHDSNYALFPDRPEVLRGVIVDATAARDAGIPHGSVKADEWGFKWVKKFCEKTGNLWMRPRAVVSAVDVLCEVWFTILAIVWITQMIAPSARRAQAGYTQGMPTSALLAIYGHQRVMRDCGRFTPDLAQTRAVLKGLCARFKLRWGDDAFVPQRMQPFSRDHLVAIVAALVSVTTLPAWTSVLRWAVLTAFCYAISTGARKDEWTASFAGDTFVRRSNFTWVDPKGDDLPSTPQTVASRVNGNLLRGRSAPSKCDRLNISWGGRDMWFRYDDTNPLNFAWRWRQWEEAHPCPPGERTRWPAFSPTGDATPFTGGRAESCLNVLLAAVMTVAEAAKRSWHSARITLATRLFARRGSGADRSIARDEIEGVIQSLVRWKTLEAMRIYARMEPETYASYVDMATDLGQDSCGEMPADLCEVDPRGVVTEHEATITAIDAVAAKAAKAAKAARAESVTGAPAASQAKGGKGGPRGVRRDAPVTGDVHADAEEPEAKRRAFDIGGGQAVVHKGDDTWRVVGQKLKLHNSFWGIPVPPPPVGGGQAPSQYSECIVVAYIGEYRFPDTQRSSKHTYVIECEGFHYPVRHSAVAGAIEDGATRRRIQKAGPPRLM